MSTTQPRPQHLKPQTLRERLCHVFHRQPATTVPHWDALHPEDLPTFDLEAEWALLLPRITRLALDEDHGDVADRLVDPRVDAYHKRLDRLLADQQEALAVYMLQGREHLVALGMQVEGLRNEQARHAERMAHAWEALSGTAPATAPAVPVRVRPQSTDPVMPQPVAPALPSVATPPTPVSDRPDDSPVTSADRAPVDRDGSDADGSRTAAAPTRYLRPIRQSEEEA